MSETYGHGDFEPMNYMEDLLPVDQEKAHELVCEIHWICTRREDSDSSLPSYFPRSISRSHPLPDIDSAALLVHGLTDWESDRIPQLQVSVVQEQHLDGGLVFVQVANFYLHDEQYWASGQRLLTDLTNKHTNALIEPMALDSDDLSYLKKLVGKF